MAKPDTTSPGVDLRAFPRAAAFRLSQAVAVLESCDCTVYAANFHADTGMMYFTVAWANTEASEGRKYLVVRLENYQPDSDLTWMSAWQSAGFNGEPYEYNSGVYLSEVLGHICRIWATG